jgi:hypothetical protein
MKNGGKNVAHIVREAHTSVIIRQRKLKSEEATEKTI